MISKAYGRIHKTDNNINKNKKVPRQAHNVSSLTNLQSRVASAHLLPDTNWCKAAG